MKMDQTDRREEFAAERWQQGRLLNTAETRRWTKAQRAEAAFVEKSTAFAGFSASDQGRSREFVFRYGSSSECRAAVEWHNYDLDRP